MRSLCGVLQRFRGLGHISSGAGGEANGVVSIVEVAPGNAHRGRRVPLVVYGATHERGSPAGRGLQRCRPPDPAVRSRRRVCENLGAVHLGIDPVGATVQTQLHRTDPVPRPAAERNPVCREWGPRCWGRRPLWWARRERLEREVVSRDLFVLRPNLVVERLPRRVALRVLNRDRGDPLDVPGPHHPGEQSPNRVAVIERQGFAVHPGGQDAVTGRVHHGRQRDRAAVPVLATKLHVEIGVVFGGQPGVQRRQHLGEPSAAPLGVAEHPEPNVFKGRLLEPRFFVRVRRNGLGRAVPGALHDRGDSDGRKQPADKLEGRPQHLGSRAVPGTRGSVERQLVLVQIGGEGHRDWCVIPNVKVVVWGEVAAAERLWRGLGAKRLREEHVLPRAARGVRLVRVLPTVVQAIIVGGPVGERTDPEQLQRLDHLGRQVVVGPLLPEAVHSTASRLRDEVSTWVLVLELSDVVDTIPVGDPQGLASGAVVGRDGGPGVLRFARPGLRTCPAWQLRVDPSELNRLDGRRTAIGSIARRHCPTIAQPWKPAVRGPRGCLLHLPLPLPMSDRSSGRCRLQVCSGAHRRRGWDAEGCRCCPCTRRPRRS
eukprot:m.17074 g.17074  ORF g.17074 m.17074 type:complete len:598 (+) comp9202_c0_seq1:180-1973(+)